MPALAEASLSDTDRRVLDRFVAALREGLGEALDSVWLYGSRARGEPPREDSDVDLMVFVTGEPDERSTAVHELLWDAAWEEDAGLFDYSVHVKDRRWLEGRRAIRSFFIQEVDRDKIVLHGKP